MNTISINYTLKWEIDFAPHYKFTICKKLVNCKSGKIIKKVYNNGCIGYVIQGKFYSLTKLKTYIKIIKKQTSPF
jgi:hypothetical protein